MENELILRLNLQFFAKDGPEGKRQSRLQVRSLMM